MNCDYCGKLLLYWREIVEVSPSLDGLKAAITQESTRDNREMPASSGKYHSCCYAAAREIDGRLPVVNEN